MDESNNLSSQPQTPVSPINPPPVNQPSFAQPDVVPTVSPLPTAQPLQQSIPPVTPQPVVPEPSIVQAEGVTTQEYAGFWIRVLASFLDSFVMCFVMIPIFLGLSALGILPQGTNVEVGYGGYTSVDNQQASPFGLMIFQLIFGLIVLVYIVVMLKKFGGTVGKLILGLRVVNSGGGELGIGQILLRETIGKIVSLIVLYIGFIMVGFDERKQGLHDKIAGTFVIKTR